LRWFKIYLPFGSGITKKEVNVKKLRKRKIKRRKSKGERRRRLLGPNFEST